MKYLDAMNFCPGCGAALADMERAEESETTTYPREQVEEAKQAQTREEPAQAGKAQTESAALPGNAAPINADIPLKIENHLVKAIIANLCCCPPFGIVALIYASSVEPKLGARDFAGASDASRKANLWGNLSIGLGVLISVLWAIFYTFLFSGAINLESILGSYLNGMMRLGS
jgi:hypothetical protein